MRSAWASTVVVAAAAAAGPAAAGEVFFGAYAHDVSDGVAYGRFEDGLQIMGGVRTTSLDELAFLGKPRAHLFAAANTLEKLEALEPHLRKV